MNRDQRADIAKETLTILDEGSYTLPSGKRVEIAPALAASIDGTRLYRPDDLPARSDDTRGEGATTCRMELTRETTLDAARRLRAEYAQPDPLCLNFASAKNPGGGFLSGSQAQEESLARSSGLYASLTHDMTMYEHNRSLGTLLYSDHMIYSPNVPVFRDDDGALLEEPYTASFITAPAVNAGAIARNEPERLGLIPSTMRKRLNRVLEAARLNGHSALVLGAWGCGVFGNDPTLIARLYRDALGPGGAFASSFERVVFAVYDRSADRSVIGPFSSILQGLTVDPK
jgi:uncharacterized protein (TIGR02452 family)